MTARSVTLNVPSGGIGSATATCQPGEVATGGGVRYLGAAVMNLRIVASAPNGTVGVPTGWFGRVENGGAPALQVIVTVTCARP